MAEIFGVGIDQIRVSRVEEACKRASFLQKYYSERERGLIEERPSRRATNFAGKEAVAKALGTGFAEGILPREIEILRRENGAPYVRLCGKALEWANRHQVTGIHISLSDTEEYASAYAVAETGGTAMEKRGGIPLK